MATVSEILAKKGNQVETIGPEATAYDAARRMTERKIGCLVVTEGDKVCGIVSERDVLQKLVAEKRSAEQTPVRDIMTAQVRCCRADTSVDEIRYVMMDRRIRHLPVIDEGEKLVGIVSIGDANAMDAHSKEQTIHLMQEYIYGHTLQAPVTG
ncbi:MAG: CBS domain-containing protein [Gemmataceae bacterium]